MGIFSDLTTTNFWAYLGPDGTIWNSYVLGGGPAGLYTYTDQRFDWVPSLAADFPTSHRRRDRRRPDSLDHRSRP